MFFSTKKRQAKRNHDTSMAAWKIHISFAHNGVEADCTTDCTGNPYYHRSK